MATTAAERNEVRVKLLDFRSKGDVEGIRMVRDFMQSEDWRESTGRYEPEPPEDFDFDTQSGIDDNSLRSALSSTKSDPKGTELVFRKRGLEPEKDWTRNSQGDLAITPTGMVKLGREPDPDGLSILIDAERAEIGDIADLTGIGPEVAGTLIGGAIGAASPIPGGAVIGATLGGGLGQAVEELTQTILGIQGQTPLEQLGEIGIEAAAGGIGEGVGLLAFKGLRGLARGGRKVGSALKDAKGKISGSPLPKSGLETVKPENIEFAEEVLGGTSTLSANVGPGFSQSGTQMADRLRSGIAGSIAARPGLDAADAALSLFGNVKGSSDDIFKAFKSVNSARKAAGLKPITAQDLSDDVLGSLLKNPNLVRASRGSVDDLIEGFAKQGEGYTAARKAAEREVDNLFPSTTKFADFGNDTFRAIQRSADDFYENNVRKLYKEFEVKSGGIKIAPVKAAGTGALKAGLKKVPEGFRAQAFPVVNRLQDLLGTLPERISLSEADNVRKIFNDIIRGEIGLGKQSFEGVLARRVVKAIDQSLDNLDKAVRGQKVDVGTLISQKEAVTILKAARKQNVKFRSIYDNKSIQSLKINAQGEPIDPARLSNTLLQTNRPKAIEAIQRALPQEEAYEFTAALRHNLLKSTSDQVAIAGKGNLAQLVQNKISKLGSTNKPLFSGSNVLKERSIGAVKSLQATTVAEQEFGKKALVKALKGAKTDLERSAHFEAGVKYWLSGKEGLLQFDDMMKELPKSIAEKMRLNLMLTAFGSQVKTGMELKGTRFVSGLAIEKYIAGVTPQVAKEAFGPENFANLRALQEAFKAQELAPGGAAGIMEAGLQIATIASVLQGNPTLIVAKMFAHYFSTAKGHAHLKPVLKAIQPGGRKKIAKSLIEKLGKRAKKGYEKWLDTEDALRFMRILSVQGAMEAYDEQIQRPPNSQTP